jgi:hypothetical protein
VEKLARRIYERFRDEAMAYRVASRVLVSKGDRVLVKNKNDKTVLVKPETLKEEPGKYHIIREVPGRPPNGKPRYHKDPLPRPPALPKLPLPDPMPRPKKPKKLPTPVKIPEPPEPRRKKPAPGQKGWKPDHR